MQDKEEDIKNIQEIVYEEIKRLFGNYALRFIVESKYDMIVLKRDMNLYEMFLVSKELKQLWLTIQDRIKQKPYSIGLFAGSITKRKGKLKLKIGLDLMEFLAQRLRRNIVIVNDHAAMLFLYGRDIMLNSIVDILPPIGYLTVVANRGLEILGLAKLLINIEGAINKGAKKDVIALKNVIDKGWYLRKGG